MNIINKMIGFNLSNLVSTFIRIKEQLLEEDEELPETIINWPLFIQNGLNSKTQLILLQLGFTEKISMLLLSEYIRQFYSDNFISTGLLTNFIKMNKKQILFDLRPSLPRIAYRKLKKNLNYVTRNLW